ncbi:hypothetical protein Trydic_g4435 [Trypoxylus dichotomus]
MYIVGVTDKLRKILRKKNISARYNIEVNRPIDSIEQRYIRKPTHEARTGMLMREELHMQVNQKEVFIAEHKNIDRTLGFKTQINSQ